jgi:hypothetical protein
MAVSHSHQSRYYHHLVQYCYLLVVAGAPVLTYHRYIWKLWKHMRNEAVNMRNAQVQQVPSKQRDMHVRLCIIS